MYNALAVNLNDPLVQAWALHRHGQLMKTTHPAHEEIASAWFHDLYIARLFDQEAHKTLAVLFWKLPASRFASFIPQMLKQWLDWPHSLAGAALPILAVHAPIKLCALVESYLNQTHANQLSVDRLGHLDTLVGHEAFAHCWVKLVQLIQTMSPGRLERGIFNSILLRHAHTLESDALFAALDNAWREESRLRAQDSILGDLFQGLFGHSDFLDLVQARGGNLSTQRLAPLAPLFIDTTPLHTLDLWLDKAPPLQDALDALASAGNAIAACQVLHQLLARPEMPALLGERITIQLAVAGSLQGYAQDTMALANLALADTMTLLAADLQGDRGMPALIAHLQAFAHDEVASQLTSQLRANYENLGGSRLAMGMGLLGWPEFVPFLIDALAGDKGDYVCEAAMTALVRIGAPARDTLIARWDELDRSQHIYGLTVIRDVGGDATAVFAAARFDALLSDDIESACALAQAEPDLRLLERLRAHLHRRQPLIDRAYATLAKLLDREDEAARQAHERVIAEENRVKAIQARMEQGDLGRQVMELDLRCPACGETNSYLVSGVVMPGEVNSQLPYLIEDEIPCASCAQDVEYEFTSKAILALAAELVLIQAASSNQQDREPLVRFLNVQIEGQIMPIAAALQRMRQQVKAQPNNARSWFRLANLLFMLNRPRSALSALNNAVMHAPHVMDIIVSRAQMLSKLGREVESLESLCKALEQRPAWQFWGSVDTLGQQFVELYNLLRRNLGRQNLPALHPASIKPVQPAKLGRNDPCPCGSGKKYKKCCGE
jgi:tetratricopeptide (TPR) repeat protein